MAIQTEYPLEMTVAFEGMLADGSNDIFRWSATNTAADSFFGRACLAVAGDGSQFVQPTGVAGVFMGILQHSHSVAIDSLTDQTADHPQNKPGNIMRKGRIWVVAEDIISDVTAGVFYRHTTPGAAPEALGR